MKKIDKKQLENQLSFNRSDYEKVMNEGIVSFDKFLENVIETTEENNGDLFDAVFIAEDAFVKLEEKNRRTYDIHFNDPENSNSEGFKESFEYCKQYIEMHNGSNHSYFADYKRGTVSIVCNETGETVFEEEIK